MRPICDAGVWLGCGAPAVPGAEVVAPAVDDDPAVDVVADDAVVAVDDAAAGDDAAADEAGASVDEVVLSSLPHAETTRHAAATAPKHIRELLFMVPLPP